MAMKTVAVYVKDGQLTAEPEDIEVARGDLLIWSAEDCLKIEIEFEARDDRDRQGPLDWRGLRSQAAILVGGNVRNDAPRDDDKRGHKYTVWPTGNPDLKEIDPHVRVR